MRDAGMTQTCFFKSISFHVAPMTSPVRAAHKIAYSKARALIESKIERTSQQWQAQREGP
jgi:hypothetical protein